MIGDDIEIVVVDIDRGKIRLGIKAPRTMPVDRKEVFDAKKADVERIYVENNFPKEAPS